MPWDRVDAGRCGPLYARSPPGSLGRPGSVVSARAGRGVELAGWGQRGQPLLNKAIDELVDKYGTGTLIADVPSSPSGLAGRRLRGDLVLGIPVQVEPLPANVLAHARDLGVTLVEIHVPKAGG